MKSLRRFFARLLNLTATRVQDERLREEIEGHIALQTQENIRAGLSPVEARRQAILKFGGVEAVKQDYQAKRGLPLVENFLQDVRFAIRGLRRTPGLTAFVVVTLALGIGMTSATFSMVDALIFRPYPVPHPGNIVTLVSTTRDTPFDNFSYREYQDIHDKTTSYDGVIAYTDMEAVGFSAQAGATPQVRGGMMVSGNYFDVLGVVPRLGRAFREEEDKMPGRDAVVVLGSDFWRHQFASDPSVVGRTVRLNGKDFTVIGVAPETFPGLLTFGHPDPYVPLAMAPVFSTNLQKNFFEDRDDRELNVKGRLKPGTTLEQARSELAVIAKNFESEYSNVTRGRGAAVYTQFQARTIEDENWKFGVVFVILALAVLLVACTNVAGLLLSRARARAREIAVRLALGAGRLRLIRLLLTESLILATLGGGAGAAVGYGVIEWFHSKQSVVFMTDLPNAVPMSMDTRVLIACVALSVLCALLCGLAPALQSTRVDLVNALKSADVDEDIPGRKRLWGRNMLVVTQVAMSLMLLTASFLMARGFQHDMMQDSNFTKDHLLMTSFDPRLIQYSATQTQQFYKVLAERMRGTSGVQSVALTQNVPLGQTDFDGVTFVPDAFQMPPDRANFSSMMDTVDEGYFETMGIPILRGRAFLESDSADAPRVAIVNMRFAKHFWPGGDAVGKRIRLDSSVGTPVEIVGVAETVKYQSSSSPMDFVYMPLAQHPVARMVLMLRTRGDPRQLIPPVKDAVRSLDPNLPVLQTRAYEEFYLNQAVYGPRIAIDLVGSMGLVDCCWPWPVCTDWWRTT